MWLYFLVSLAVFALDRVSKWLVVRRLAPGESVAVIPHILMLTYVKNSGGAFGILAHHRDQFVLLGLILLVAMLMVSLYLARGNILLSLALAFLTGGILGNLVDRLQTGYVIDFLDLRFWPVFNIADTFICIGAALLIYILLFSREGGKGEAP